jgi:hypothetical protein
MSVEVENNNTLTNPSNPCQKYLHKLDESISKNISNLEELHHKLNKTMIGEKQIQNFYLTGIIDGMNFYNELSGVMSNEIFENLIYNLNNRVDNLIYSNTGKDNSKRNSNNNITLNGDCVISEEEVNNPNDNSIIATNIINLSEIKNTPQLLNQVEEVKLEFLACSEVLDINKNYVHLEEYENIKKEHFELIKLNEILEREMNLLKSLILINNLNLNSSDSKALFHDNYFLEMCDEGNLQQIIKDDKKFEKQENLNVLTLKINNLKERLDLFKKEFLEEKSKFNEYMGGIHNRIMEHFGHEIKIRRTIEEKVSNIKKLI